MKTQEAIEDLKYLISGDCTDSHMDFVEEIEMAINALEKNAEQSAADVVEVRHGHWEWFEEWIPSTPDNVRECEECGWRCSECKTALADAVGGYWDDVSETPKLQYCPICGAIMGGKRKDGAK